MPENSPQQKLAIYPGTFDPITNGHLSLLNRAVNLFDRLYVAVAANAGKNPLFTHDERWEMARAGIKPNPKIEVIKFDGLLAEFARKMGACAIVRGLRAISDFEYEFQMALMNRKLARSVETVFLMPSLPWVYLSSTIVKDVAYNRGDVKELVPAPVYEALLKKFPPRTK